MAIIRRVTRIANPRRKIRTVRRAKARAVKRRHNSATRKRSAPVIRRYSVKTLKKELRRRGVKTNPRAHRKVKRRATRRSNPVLLEFGAINPFKKRRKSVARKHRRSRNTRRRAVARVHHRKRRRASNPMGRVHHRVHHRRRRNRVHHYARRRRNPMGFSNKQLLETSTGVLLGVAAVKYIPTMLPASMTSMLPATSFTAPVITAVSTFAAYWLGAKFLPPDVAKGIAIGGGALVVSQFLNVIAPPSISGPLALAGVGDIVQTMGFAVPDRSMRQQVIQMAPAPSGAGVGFYRRRRIGPYAAA